MPTDTECRRSLLDQNTGGGTTAQPSQPSKPSQPPQPSKPGNIVSGNTTTAQGKTLGLKLKKSSYTYTGKPIKPTVTVKVQGGKKLAKKYYTISYKNNKKVGIATVTVKGKGKYKGYSGKALFQIEPKKMTLTSVKSAKKKQAFIKWKKDSQAGRYELQVSVNKKFKKAGVINVDQKKTSYTAKGFKSKKNVYVRIRSVKDMKYGTLYGPWSSTKKVKVK